MNTLSLLYGPKATPISLSIHSKSYILAFPMNTLAKKAQTWITPVTRTQMYLSHHITQPSQKESYVLSELELDPRVYNIVDPYIDNSAYLHIPKYKNDGCYLLLERSLVDMILYPFVKNIGLIIPLGIMEETSDELILESQLIEPSVNLDLFRKDLEQCL